MSEAFFDMTRQDLELKCKDLGLPEMHAKALFRSAYKNFDRAPWLTAGLPKRLVTEFSTFTDSSPVSIESEHVSSYDGSVKFVVILSDFRKVEMVLMPEAKRITLCVSSQVGCAQGCTFCHTGRMGLVRNLSTAEIVGQVWTANNWIREHVSWLDHNRLPISQMVTNIVFMGMGEPLDNVDHVARAISILIDPYGGNFPIRKISVSTAGHLEGLERLLEIHPDARLAVSIHSADSSERSRLMPINRKWPIEDFLARLKQYPLQQIHGFLVQYTLIKGVNDSTDHAKRLVELVAGMNVKVNLIPLNPVGPSRFKTIEIKQLEEFRDVIYASGIRVLVRYSKGQDIAAACGQLVV